MNNVIDINAQLRHRSIKWNIAELAAKARHTFETSLIGTPYNRLVSGLTTSDELSDLGDSFWAALGLRADRAVTKMGLLLSETLMLESNLRLIFFPDYGIQEHRTFLTLEVTLDESAGEPVLTQTVEAEEAGRQLVLQSILDYANTFPQLTANYMGVALGVICTLYNNADVVMEKIVTGQGVISIHLTCPLAAEQLTMHIKATFDFLPLILDQSAIDFGTATEAE